MLFHDCQVLSVQGELVELRCHPLPGTSAWAAIRRACAALGLEFLYIEQPVIEGLESVLDPATEVIIERAAGMRAAPIFTGGPSDNHWLRRAGMQVFGFFPGPSAEEVVRIHKPNERLRISSFRTAVRVLAETARLLCE
jgi:acetylornithine deacetylase/succinyl-diaminopimelate desuccinylase-like protein